MRRQIFQRVEWCVICQQTEYLDRLDPDVDIIGEERIKVVCSRCAEAVGFVKDNLDSLKAILNHFMDSTPPAEIPLPDDE